MPYEKPYLWEPIIKGNLGGNQYQRKNYKVAAKLISEAVDSLYYHGDYGYAYGASPVIALCYIKLNNLEKAKYWIDFADSCESKLWDHTRPSRRELYIAKSNYYARKGDWTNSWLYQDSAIIDNDDRNMYYNMEHLFLVEKEMGVGSYKKEGRNSIATD